MHIQKYKTHAYKTPKQQVPKLSCSNIQPSSKKNKIKIKSRSSHRSSQTRLSRSSHTSDLKIGTAVATLPGAWRSRVSAGTGRPSMSILWLGEVESWICNFYLSVAARTIVWADSSPRDILLGRKATNQQLLWLGRQSQVSLTQPSLCHVTVRQLHEFTNLRPVWDFMNTWPEYWNKKKRFWIILTDVKMSLYPIILCFLLLALFFSLILHCVHQNASGNLYWKTDCGMLNLLSFVLFCFVDIVVF